MPRVSDVVLKVALDPLTFAVANTVLLSKNLTVPVGVSLPRVGAIDTLNVNMSPVAPVVGLAVNVTAVATGPLLSPQLERRPATDTSSRPDKRWMRRRRRGRTRSIEAKTVALPRAT